MRLVNFKQKAAALWLSQKTITTISNMEIVQAEDSRELRRNAFNKTQKMVSDFGKAIKAIEKKGGKA